MSHVTHMNESCHIHNRGPQQPLRAQNKHKTNCDCIILPPKVCLSHVNRSHHEFRCGMSHTRTNNVMNMNKTCHAVEYAKWEGHTQTRTQTHTPTHTHRLNQQVATSFFSFITHSCVWRDCFIFVTWFIHICDVVPWYSWRVWFVWVTHMRDMTHSYVRHASLIYVTWPICVCV